MAPIGYLISGWKGFSCVNLNVKYILKKSILLYSKEWQSLPYKLYLRSEKMTIQKIVSNLHMLQKAFSQEALQEIQLIIKEIIS